MRGWVLGERVYGTQHRWPTVIRKDKCMWVGGWVRGWVGGCWVRGWVLGERVYGTQHRWPTVIRIARG